ncbi:MAG: GatB/YqeY domain-containing protein [Finegoldia sp.]|nr:GatB/YqeY domain-containing protein [Finegoldia sp.]
MRLVDQMRKDKMLAAKDKDKLKAGVISLMMSNILLAEKEGKKELSEEEQIEFVQKELKQTTDALEQVPDSREDLIEENKRKIEIIKSYLPEQLSEDEIKEIVEKYIEENKLERTNKSRGPIMSYVMSEYKGKTDGKSVNKVVGEILK